MTVEDFCRSEQVSVPLYYYWKEKLAPIVGKKSSKSGSLKRKSNPAFTQLVMSQAQTQLSGRDCNPLAKSERTPNCTLTLALN
jgi:hypothetical protein